MRSSLGVRIRKVVLLFCFFSVMTIHSKSLQAVDGKTFLEYCQAYIDVIDNKYEQTQEPIGAGYCLGFVTGAHRTEPSWYPARGR